MKAIYLKRAGIALMTVMAMASCSDVVNIPSYDPYSCDGAPVIEAIYDAQDVSETPQAITGGVLNQMIKIKGKNLSHVKSISFNGLEVDVRHAAYAERDFCNVTIPRKIPEEVTNKLVYTTEQGTVTVDFPVNIPNLQLDGLKNEFTLQGDKVQVMGDYFDLYGFSKDEELNTATITIHNDDLGYSEVIPTDSITETYMGILIPKDAPDNSLITFEWDGMDGRKTKTIPYRMSDQLMFSNMEGDLGWWNDWLKSQLTWGGNSGDPKCLGYQFIRLQKNQDLSSSIIGSWSWNSTGMGCNWRWLDASANPEKYVLKFEVCTASSKPFYNYGDNGKAGSRNGGYMITLNGGATRNQWDPVSDGLNNTYGEWQTISLPLVDCLGGSVLPTEPDQWVSLEFVCQPNSNEDWQIDHSFGQFRIEPAEY